MISLEDMIDAANPDGVNGFSHKKQPFIQRFATAIWIVQSIFLDSRKLSKNCWACDMLLDAKNVDASLLGSVGITDPCEEATRIICWILSDNFPNEFDALSWLDA